MLKVKFRKIDYQRDLVKLFEYMTDDDNQKLFSHAFQIHDYAMNETWLRNKLSSGFYHDFFMIENNKAETIGFTFSYDYYYYDSHCKYTLCLFDEYRHKGYGAISGIKMIDYLFGRYPLRRIFVSVFDYNIESLCVNLKGGFEEVGNIPEYIFKDGSYHSLHTLTISREQFYKRYERVINKL